jgi:predicted Zn-dependent protease with MMP-like domain
MTREEFDQQVEESLIELPEYFKEKMENIAIYVEDYPTGDLSKKFSKHGLLGVFIGIPITQQSWEGGYPPHRIILYQKNIESICSNNEEIRFQIRETVIHEIGHYFGLSEADLRRLQGI